MIAVNQSIQPSPQPQDGLTHLQLHNGKSTSRITAGGQICTIDGFCIDVIAIQRIAITSPAECTLQGPRGIGARNPFRSRDFKVVFLDARDEVFEERLNGCVGETCDFCIGVDDPAIPYLHICCQ